MGIPVKIWGGRVGGGGVGGRGVVSLTLCQLNFTQIARVVSNQMNGAKLK